MRISCPTLDDVNTKPNQSHSLVKVKTCKVHPFKMKHCSAYGKTCSNYGEKNHVPSKCPFSEQQKQRLQKVHKLQAQEESAGNLSSVESDYIDAVTSPGLRNEVKCQKLMSKLILVLMRMFSLHVATLLICH